ncbi:MAG: hypothetical protein R2795_25625 [Saprospiraceae bacterium]
MLRVSTSSTLYQSPLGIEIPVSFEIVRKSEEYLDTKSGKVKKRSPKTKNEMLRDQLFVLVKYNRVPFRYVVWDTWFSAQKQFRTLPVGKVLYWCHKEQP